MKYVLGLVALALAATTACTGSNAAVNNATDTAAAQADYCTSLNLLKTDLLSLQALGPSSTVGQMRDGVNKIQDDLNQLQKDAKTLNNAKTDQLSSSYQNLQRSAQGLSDNTTFVAAVATLTPQLAAINQAQNQAKQTTCQ